MSGEMALDTSVAIRFLNGDSAVTAKVLSRLEIVLPVVVAGELLLRVLERSSDRALNFFLVHSKNVRSPSNRTICAGVQQAARSRLGISAKENEGVILCLAKSNQSGKATVS